MSDAHDAHGAEAHGADAHHDDFDPEPAHELSPGEPRTPGWVPALGLALFVVAGLVLLIGGADAGASEGKSAPAKAAPAAPPAAAPPPARPAQLPGMPMPRPAQPGATAGQPAPPPQGGQLQRLTTEEMRRVQERLRQARPAPGSPAAPAAPAPAPAHAPH